MLDYVTEFRTMASLEDEQKEVLMSLTSKSENRRSVFQQWLRHPNPLGMYAGLVKSNKYIIAWAAVSTCDGWNMGTIGVFVKPDYRNMGFAYIALDTLLMNLSKVNIEDRSEYLSYNEGLEHIFRPTIERYGFKDLFKYKEEYNSCRQNLLLSNEKQD